MDTRYNLSKLKFDGKLETPADCVTKYEKEEFIQAVKEQVSCYGLQTLFAMPTVEVTLKIWFLIIVSSN